MPKNCCSISVVNEKLCVCGCLCLCDGSFNHLQSWVQEVQERVCLVPLNLVHLTTDSLASGGGQHAYLFSSHLLRALRLGSCNHQVLDIWKALLSLQRPVLETEDKNTFQTK